MKQIGGLKKGLMYAMVTTMLTSGVIGMTSLDASAATTGKVNTSALNVRSGAGTGYSWVGTVRQGQTVTIVDSVKASDGYTWYKISGTTSGYVRGDYISNVVSDDVSSSTGMTTADVLNVRTGAGRNYSVMGTASYGTRLTVIAKSGEWYKVTCKVEDSSGNVKVRTGYVHKDYVKLDASTGNSSGSSNSGSSNTGSSNTGSSSSGSTSTDKVIATGIVNASALNLRSGAGTGYSSIALLNNKTALDILSQSGSWYKVRCTVNGVQKTGYVHSDYVTKTATNNSTTQTSGTGVVNADALNVRSGAGTSHSVLFVIRKNAKVEIISQVGNWYNIKCTYNGATKTGYVAAEYITRTTTVTPTPKPETESKVPETESKEPETEGPTVEPEKPEFKAVNGVLNGDEVRVRAKADYNSQVYGFVNKGKKVVVIGEEGEWYKVKIVINGSTKEAYIYAEYITLEKETSDNESGNNSGSDNNDNTDNNTSTNQNIGILTGDGVYLRKGPGTNNAKIDQLHLGAFVTILGEENGWYKVSCIASGSVKEGYIYAQWVKPLNAHNAEYDGELDADFEKQIAAFPESYKNALRRLHDEHPNWTFVAYDTGMDFNDVLTTQYDGKVSMIYFDKDTTPYSWLSTKTGDYDWATDTYVNRDGADWKSASKEVLAYYLDPRNFLLEGEIFMFESMAYDSSMKREVVADILDGSYMTDGKKYTYNGKTYTYVDTFMEAGRIAQVSPYILASRSRQEIGSGSEAVTGGKYFNFYNIGANSSSSGNAVTNGLNYAASGTTWRRPWTSPWLAIVGGAEFIGESYIAKGQNTDYFQKFNVVCEPYEKHQYMTNIQAPAKEGSSRYDSYQDIGVLDANFTFIIPVYDNMPEKACQMPIEAGNPNGYLKKLTVSGMSLNQTFRYNVTEYYGATNQSSVTISASAISKHAKVVSGTGTYNLVKGENKLTVVCQAGNGKQVTYTLNITRY